MTLTAMKDIQDMDDDELLEYINECETENAAMVDIILDLNTRLHNVLGYALAVRETFLRLSSGVYQCMQGDQEVGSRQLISATDTWLELTNAEPMDVVETLAKDKAAVYITGNGTKH